jgi:hypothetical protein
MANSMEELMIGRALSDLGVVPVHDERFHQFRPGDYDRSLLQRQDPVTFHRVSNPRVYEEWFLDADTPLLDSMATATATQRTEL